MRVHHAVGIPWTSSAGASSSGAAATAPRHEGRGDEGPVHAQRDATGSARSAWTTEGTARVTAGAARAHEESTGGSRRGLTHRGAGVEVEISVRRGAVGVKLGTI